MIKYSKFFYWPQTPWESGEYDVYNGYKWQRMWWEEALGVWRTGPDGNVVHPDINSVWRGLAEAPYDEVWTSADGRQTKVANMHEEHVRNVLRLLIRTARNKKEQAKRAVMRELANKHDIDYSDPRDYY